MAPSLWDKLRGLFRGVVEEVPPEMAACEYGCRELECSHGRWDACEHRLEVAEKIRGEEARDVVLEPAARPLEGLDEAARVARRESSAS